MAKSPRICVGQIAVPHGVRGLVKLRSFTEDPADIAAYGPLTDESGRREFRVELLSATKDGFIARIDGIGDRTAAEGIQGTRLYVDRDRLPPPDEEEFYHADLIGLRVELASGGTLGTVVGVFDFGGGDMVEVRRPGGGTVMIPFTRDSVPVVDVAGGRIVAAPPPGVLEPVPEEPGNGSEGGSGDAS